MQAEAFPRPVLVVAVLAGAALLRFLFPTADPPVFTEVGTAWVDEGAWLQNARAKVLFGDWFIDQWRPIYTTPVFTWLGYVSFELFGVGAFSARLVSMGLGTASIGLLYGALAQAIGQRAALFGAALLGTEYVYVMHNRLATLETTMLFFMILTLYAVARAERTSWFMVLAGASAIMAVMTKASAMIFIGVPVIALVLLGLVRGWRQTQVSQVPVGRLLLLYTIGVAGMGAVWFGLWVAPHWSDVWFYNVEYFAKNRFVQTPLTILQHLIGFPLFHAFFARMPVVTLGALGAFALLLIRLRWHPGQVRLLELLLAVWCVIVAAFLLFGDMPQRRYVPLIPALAGLAAIFLNDLAERDLEDGQTFSQAGRAVLWSAGLIAIFVLCGGTLRWVTNLKLREIAAGAGFLTILASVGLLRRGMSVGRGLPEGVVLRRIGWTAVTLSMAVGLGQFAIWTAGRSYVFPELSRRVGVLVGDGVPVQGDAAIALSLENRSKSYFVGERIGDEQEVLRGDGVDYLLVFPDARLDERMQKLMGVHANTQVVATFDVSPHVALSYHRRIVLMKKRPKGAAQQ